MNEFDAGLRKMGNGIRRAQQGFTEADEGFRHADEGFVEALQALQTVSIARGTLDERFKDMMESIARLEAMVIAQTADLRAQREELQALRQRLDQPPTP